MSFVCLCNLLLLKYGSQKKDGSISQCCRKAISYKLHCVHDCTIAAECHFILKRNRRWLIVK